MFSIEREEGFVYIGETKDIKATYTSLRKAIAKAKTNLKLLYQTPARFTEKAYYGLKVENGYISIINSDTALGIVIEEIKKTK